MRRVAAFGAACAVVLAGAYGEVVISGLDVRQK
jgi:hypothetical protein